MNMSRRRRHRRVPRCSYAVIDALESRRLLYSYSGDLNFPIDGTTIDYFLIDNFPLNSSTIPAFSQSGFSGTAKNDRIIVSLAGGSPQPYVIVSVNGVQYVTHETNLHIYANAGDDVVSIETTDPTVSVTVYGAGGNDSIFCGAGDDRVYGGDGNDSILGGGGKDRVYGEAG